MLRTISILEIASILVYILAIIWIKFFFQSVSISTLEAKPRSLFVDEHSILLHSKLLSNIQLPDDMFINRYSDNYDSFNMTIKNLAKNSHLKFSVESKFSPQEGTESIGLVLLIPINCAVHDSFIQLLQSIIYTMENSRWLTKKVQIILDFRSGVERLQTKESWTQQLIESSAIREVFVFNFFNFEDQCTSTEYAKELSWQRADVRSHGYSGNLPNMDLISFSKSIFETIYGQPLHFEIIDFECWSTIQNIRSFSPYQWFDIAKVCLAALFETNPHANLLLHNVDSITFGIHGKSPTNSEKYYKLKELSKFVISILYQSNNLEGMLEILR